VLLNKDVWGTQPPKQVRVAVAGSGTVAVPTVLITPSKITLCSTLAGHRGAGA
jgi:hypothetical protein